MPAFESIFDCQNIGEDNADLCVSVKFPNSIEDMLILTQVPETSIYEGYLRDENEVPVVLIDTPLTNKRMVIMSQLVFLKYSLIRYL